MSIFGNETEGMGLRLGPGPEIEGDSDFAALGKPVPMYRRAAANAHCKEMLGDAYNTEMVFRVIEQMSDKIQRDDPHGAMMVAKTILDVTGVYRLLAVLCSAPKPKVKVKAGSSNAIVGDPEEPHDILNAQPRYHEDD